MAQKLSAAFVAKVKEPGRYSDGAGLLLVVTPSGSKRWINRLMFRGKRSDIGLGSFPAVSLAEARERARVNKKAAQDGRDPLAEKKAAEAVPTFAAATEEFLSGKLTEFRNPKHAAQWRSTLETYALPKLGRQKVDEINVDDILRVLRPIWNEKTETATRVRGRVEAVLSFATVRGWRTGANPAAWRGNLDAALPKPRKLARVVHHPALAIDDAPAWFEKLQERDGMAARALEFVALTWARSGEVRGARWREVDLDAGTWTIPGARMKAGKEHRVALCGAALDLLRALPRIEGTGDLVFPAPRGGQLSDMSLSAVMRRMQAAEEKAGRPGWLDPRSGRPAVPHGLRSTGRDWAAERTSLPSDLVEMALAHQVGSAVERAYRRSDMIERRRAVGEAWASFLLPPQAPVVVAITRSA